MLIGWISGGSLWGVAAINALLRSCFANQFDIEGVGIFVVGMK
jgi:hypothetical protein